MIIWRPKNVIFERFLAFFKILLSSLQHPNHNNSDKPAGQKTRRHDQKGTATGVGDLVCGCTCIHFLVDLEIECSNTSGL